VIGQVITRNSIIKKKRSNSKREELEIKFLNFISIDILFHFDKYFIFLIKIECFSFKIF
jgi:hypothetical protein